MELIKPKWSEKDTRGYWSIDCSECTKGANGDESCSAGAKPKYKKGGKGSCFNGTLLPKYDGGSQDGTH